MKNKLAIALTTIIMVATLAVGANAVAWSSFTPASFTDIYVNPEFTSGVTSYELILGAHPTVSFGSGTYAVNWIQGFYAVGDQTSSTFTATDGDAPLGWDWVYKTSPGEVAGWETTGQYRLQPNQSGSFKFTALTFPDNALIAGFHLAYQTTDGQVTTFFRGETGPPPPVTHNAVPEFSTPLLATMGMMLCAGVMILNRRRGAQLMFRDLA